MHNKSFIFGMGAGILVLAGLCFFVYGLQAKATANTNEKALGDITKQYDSISKDLDGEKEANAALAAQIGELKAAAAQPQTPAFEIAPPAAPTDDEIIAKARELGMVFVMGAEGAEDESPAAEQSAAVITVDIPMGSSSQVISEILKNKGVVEDGYAFERYLYMEGVTRNIPYGSFAFTEGMTFPEVLGVLKKR